MSLVTSQIINGFSNGQYFLFLINLPWINMEIKLFRKMNNLFPLTRRVEDNENP